MGIDCLQVLIPAPGKEGMVRHHHKQHPGMQHKWLKQQGAAPDTPLDNVVIKRMRKFAAMSKRKKAALLVSLLLCHVLLTSRPKMPFH